jgi:hypothetical protein
LAKVPIIKKSNHTICILAQNQNDKKEEEEPRKRENSPYTNNQPATSAKGDLTLSDYGLQASATPSNPASKPTD